jgi:hypothetical protein
MMRPIMRGRLPTWRELHPGEDPRVEAMQMAWYRDATPAEKMRVWAGLQRHVRNLALAGIRMRHPDASPEEQRRRLADLLLGPELAAKIYGALPDAGGSSLT